MQLDTIKITGNSGGTIDLSSLVGKSHGVDVLDLRNGSSAGNFDTVQNLSAANIQQLVGNNESSKLEIYLEGDGSSLDKYSIDIADQDRYTLDSQSVAGQTTISFYNDASHSGAVQAQVVLHFS